MNEPEKVDQEPEKPEAAPAEEFGKARRAFVNVRRELSEEELSTPAVHRLLLDTLDLLEQQVAELSYFRDRFHTSDKEKAILEERVKSYTAAEVLYGICLTIGSILIGLIPYVADKVEHGDYITLGVGVLLIGAAVISKRIRK